MSTAQQPDQNVAQRGRLQDHFADASNTPERWDMLWKESYSPWDRGQASPALYDLLKERKDLVGGPWHTTSPDSRRRKRALVPGCGRGYEVIMLAQFGYDSFGLDGSETAIEEGRKLVKETFNGLPEEDTTDGKGYVTYATGDFFATTWESQVGVSDDKTTFDLIYDYTFFCALSPHQRPGWALRMAELLSPNGRLICLEFPLYKLPETGGPPFGLREATYVQHLAWPGEVLKYDDSGFVVPKDGGNSNAFMRLDRWLAKRTHKAGEGTDHISVWTHVELPEQA